MPRLAVAELTFPDGGRAFLRDAPDIGAVDGLVIALHPCPQGAEYLMVLPGEGAIRLGAEVEQQAAVFADHIDQVPDDFPRGLIVPPRGVAPAVAHDGGV